MLLFQMKINSPKYNLFLAKLKREGRPLWNGKPQTYPINYLLPVGVMLTIMKVSIILFLLVGIRNIKDMISFQLRVRIYSLLGQTEGEMKAEGCKRGATLGDCPQEHLLVIRDEKVSPFVKFEIILPLLCFLLDLPANKHCKTCSSMINLWVDSRTYQK